MSSVRSHTRVLLVVLGLLVVALSVTQASVAAPPSNDDFANATVITSLPFSGTVGITEATIESGEPIDDPYYQGRSVWYSFTPTADAVVRIDPAGSDWGAFLVVYRADGAGFAGLTRIASDNWSSATVQTLHVQAGTTYYIQGGDRYAVWGYTNTFGLNMSVVLPPPNDNFADAIAFTSVPFSDSRDLTAASVEPGEPMACGASFTGSAWYAFTPTTSGAYGAFGVSAVSVYTGTSLSDLTNVACADWPGLYFHADAGTTYYLQTYGGGGVSVEVVPPPNADFIYSPGDPSMFDDVAFSYWNGGYWDPTVNGWAWDFGDGTTATGESASHRFARDGDYTVSITVAARGGRTSSATQTVQVRTHDVTILSLVAPDKGRVGKQGVITVGIGNTRYPETVQVDLYKVTQQGDVLVGTSIQAVGVMRLKRAVNFSFNYVFTSDDAIIGKLPFKAVATIQGARDAVNGDNAATSPPTLVTK
jgi:hypothetical protein